MAKFIFLIMFYAFSCSPETSPKPARDYSVFHKEAQQFCTAGNFCGGYYFLVDLSVHSGRNRFFVYDFKQKKVVMENVVTHGSCDIFKENDDKYATARFDNRDNSHCSSLGKYKVGTRDYSSWGINVKYWLEGLEKTNSNAKDRVVVLHSWEAVSDKEIYPRHSPLSWGCPAVSDAFMKVLDAKLQATGKPVLLWIIN